MVCRKYILSNTGNTVVTFNYLKCSDSEREYQVPLRPNQTKTIQAVDGTLSYSNFFISSLNVSAETITEVYDITIYNSGNDVFCFGSGRFNLNAVTHFATLNGVYPIGWISPSLQEGIYTGLVTGQPNVNGIYKLWTNFDHSPNNGGFGTGQYTTSSLGVGPNFELFRTTPFSFNKWTFTLPESYVSGTDFSSNITFPNTTINALGLTPGVYVFVWGTSDNNTVIQLNIMNPSTPTPTPTNTTTPTVTPTNTYTPTSSSTNNTTPTVTPTNTSTPTPTPTLGNFPIELSEGFGPYPVVCDGVAGPFVNSAYVQTLDWTQITRFYSDSSLTTGYNGNNLWYGGYSSNPLFVYNSCTYQIDSDGYVVDTYCC